MSQHPHDLAPDAAAAMRRLWPEYRLTRDEGTTELAAWFLGPLGENGPVLKELVQAALDSHLADRREVYPNDPPYVTDDMKSSGAYLDAVKRTRAHLDDLLDRLRGSVPQFSYRHQGHMLWDMTLPGIAGYFAAMLYNQNNVAAEASPVTTLLEKAVGESLCELAGYDPETSWGHVACDGSIANLEAMWSARNLKYYPVALARAVANDSGLAVARDVTVVDGAHRRHRLLDLDDWALINLPVDTVLKVPRDLGAVLEEHGLGLDALESINEYTIQQLGFEAFRQQLDETVLAPVALAPATMHYSWPKAASILGLGQQSLLTVEVDRDARARLDHRKEILDRCKRERRPVIMDIAVLGSTELSSVDPLKDMLALRNAYAEQGGFFYPVHVDAAWGGYFAALLRKRGGPDPEDRVLRATTTPELMMSAYVNEQYGALPHADSMTIDPHKAGFIPYPAGGLCYRNKNQREMVTFTPRYLVHAKDDPSTGLYSAEGSKPGASAAGVYLSHKVITPDQDGYGRILGQCLFNSKRLYAGITTLNLTSEPTGGPGTYRVTPVQWLPAEREHGDVRTQLEKIHDLVVTRTNAELVADAEAMELFTELGADQVIIGYAFNPYLGGGLNTDITVANTLNEAVYAKLKVDFEKAGAKNGSTKKAPPLILMQSSFVEETYGHAFMAEFGRRMGLDVSAARLPHISFMISTTMDPWMSDTARGDFTPEIVEQLDATVRETIAELPGRLTEGAAP
ncbi:pyridoxal phosphate-dependent decarboxylase family protein [Kitasatospora sp. NPDC056184]|uniref:pyridoxal phosphate-dependent decarboxylase family protein n=1 Tax=Kitasatospora sp. NPDC056184 TaxID=3345738 RepID=UPI0035E08C4A